MKTKVALLSLTLIKRTEKEDIVNLPSDIKVKELVINTNNKDTYTPTSTFINSRKNSWS